MQPGGEIPPTNENLQAKTFDGEPFNPKDPATWLTKASPRIELSLNISRKKQIKEDLKEDLKNGKEGSEKREDTVEHDRLYSLWNKPLYSTEVNRRVYLQLNTPSYNQITNFFEPFNSQSYEDGSLRETATLLEAYGKGQHGQHDERSFGCLETIQGTSKATRDTPGVSRLHQPSEQILYYPQRKRPGSGLHSLAPSRKPPSSKSLLRNGAAYSDLAKDEYGLAFTDSQFQEGEAKASLDFHNSSGLDIVRLSPPKDNSSVPGDVPKKLYSKYLSKNIGFRDLEDSETPESNNCSPKFRPGSEVSAGIRFNLYKVSNIFYGNKYVAVNSVIQVINLQELLRLLSCYGNIISGIVSEKGDVLVLFSHQKGAKFAVKNVNKVTVRGIKIRAKLASKQLVQGTQGKKFIASEKEITKRYKKGYPNHANPISRTLHVCVFFNAFRRQVTDKEILEAISWVGCPKRFARDSNDSNNMNMWFMEFGNVDTSLEILMKCHDQSFQQGKLRVSFTKTNKG